MRAWELQQLKKAKEIYYARLGFSDDGSRTRNVSLARGAFNNCFRSKASLHELGHICKKDHSSVQYAIREHESRLFYTDYRWYYKIACQIREEVSLDVVDSVDVGSLESEIKRLNELVIELSKYKELYLTLKKTFDEF